MSIVLPPKGITRKRLSLLKLTDGNHKRELNNFLKAWTLIQDPTKHDPATDEDSFYQVATYHGMPYDKPNYPQVGLGEAQDDPINDPVGIFGGYCQHGNVLFPVWHRYYTTRLENALNNALKKELGSKYDEENDQVALHYWDETYTEPGDDPLNPNDETKSKRVPSILNDDYVTIDGKQVPNPLKNYELPLDIKGFQEGNVYNKKQGYVTKRFPYSGLMNPERMRALTIQHNDGIRDDEALGALKDNINDFIVNGRINPDGRNPATYSLYKDCLETPRDNYNLFSNTSTAGENISETLEQPHNDIHIAVGGFTKYKLDETTGEFIPVLSFNPDTYKAANGDMGSNDVASFDPIFFLHHSNVDRMFWVWQKKQNATSADNGFTINNDPTDVGITTKGQYPSAYQTADQILNMDTPLYPFYFKGSDGNDVIVTAKGCIDIEKQLGFTYSIGSLDKDSWSLPKIRKQIQERFQLKNQECLNELPKKLRGRFRSHHSEGMVYLAQYTPLFDSKTITWPKERFAPQYSPDGSYQKDAPKFKQSFVMSLENIRKDDYNGSFAVHVGIRDEHGKWQTVDQKSVLTRWERSSCGNCQNYPTVTLNFEFDNSTLKTTLKAMTREDVKIHFIYRDENGFVKTSEYFEKSDGSGPRVNHFMKFVEIAS